MPAMDITGFDAMRRFCKAIQDYWYNWGDFDIICDVFTRFRLQMARLRGQCLIERQICQDPLRISGRYRLTVT